MTFRLFSILQARENGILFNESAKNQMKIVIYIYYSNGCQKAKCCNRQMKWKYTLNNCASHRMRVVFENAAIPISNQVGEMASHKCINIRIMHFDARSITCQ